MARREVHSEDLATDEFDGVLDFASLRTGQLSRDDIQVVKPGREFAEAAEYEKFMSDVLVIVIEQTTDKNEAPAVQVGDNGEIGWIPRNRKVKIQRKFVETLAHSQVRNYSQERNPDPNADEGMTTRRSGGRQYPFSVLHDPAGPIGRKWLERMMREGA